MNADKPIELKLLLKKGGLAGLYDVETGRQVGYVTHFKLGASPVEKEITVTFVNVAVEINDTF